MEECFATQKQLKVWRKVLMGQDTCLNAHIFPQILMNTPVGVCGVRKSIKVTY